jgi:cell division cycle protein 20 (cofactor of APC complex)
VGDVLSTPAKDHIDQLLTATGSSSELNNVTSIHWVSSKFLAVGFEDSCIKVIDTSTQQTISKLNCNLVPLNSYFDVDHSERVSAINSTWDLLSSSGRDNFIVNHDLREKN